LDEVHRSERGQQRPVVPVPVLTRELLLSLTPAAQEAQLAAHVQRSVAASLHLSIEDVAVDGPLYALGMDSMTAVQLRAELESVTGHSLPLADYLQGPSITELVRMALGAKPVVMVPRLVAPGPNGDVLVGNLQQFQEDPVNYLFAMRRRYGEVVRLRLGPWTAHLISQPEHLRLVLREDASNFVKAENYANLEQLVGKGILTAEGEQWHSMRQAAQSGFTPAAMVTMAETAMPRALEVAMQRLDAAVGTQVDIEREMLRLALHAIGVGTLGLEIEGELDGVLEAIDDASAFGYDDMSAYLNLPGSTARQQSDERFAAAIGRIDALVFRSVDRALAGAPTTALQTGLCAALAGRPDARTAMRDQLVTLLMAGHDTTAEALTWTLYLLSTHPATDQQLQSEKVQAEKVQAEKGSEFLTAVIKESMRLYPPGWLFTRRVVEERQVGEWTLPARSLVLISPWVTHRDPFLWPNADEFRPERFLRPQFADGAYLPFGLGARSCIGAALAMTELRIALTALLSRYRFTSSGPAPTLSSRVTLRAKEPVLLRVDRREFIPSGGPSGEMT
jgi:cytochrome P450/acyl carrier protein